MDPHTITDLPDADIVVAFDVDNTLLDASGAGYVETVAEFLSLIDLGVELADRANAYENLRAMGSALERLGLCNPSHDRGNADALALLCLTHCVNPTLLSDLDIERKRSRGYRSLLHTVQEVDRLTRQGPPEVRLGQELAARLYIATKPRVDRLRSEVKRVASDRILTQWAEAYGEIERKQPVDDLLPVMESLVSKGVLPVVISEGRSEVQFEKLDRLGLADFFSGRVLVTEAAATVPGLSEFDEALSRVIDEAVRSSTSDYDPELVFLWYFHCLIDDWSGKTPAFFARCLHAIHANPGAPQDALDSLAFVPAQDWRERPLRFVMVGDRYDKDVLPLLDLLDPGSGLKIRLQQGKYAHLHPDEELPPDRRPDRTFTEWRALESFLTGELSPDGIKPIIASPDLVRRADVRLDYVERGLDSAYEAVRAVATAVVAMMESRV